MDPRASWIWYGLVGGAIAALLVLYACTPRPGTGWDEHPREVSQPGELGMNHPATPPHPAAGSAAPANTSAAHLPPAALENNALPPIDRTAPQTVQTAVFALGCFWGAEALYGSQPGVVRVRCGYCGGTTPNPTYHDLHGYTESVAVDFDPAVTSYASLVDVFWANCSPTQKAWSVQYKSAIFYDGEAQEKTALASREGLARQLGAQVPIDVLPVTHFYTAEDYHQHYRLRNTRDLMTEFDRCYPAAQDFLNSTAAAKINGYLSGYGSPEQLTKEIAGFGLTPAGQKLLTEIVASHPAEGCGR